MASQELDPPRFQRFPHLPPELRIQIWEFALPEQQPGLALYPWKKGCWELYYLIPSDPDYGQSVFGVKFRHQMLDATRIDIPMASVSAEAHSVALKWAAQQGVEVRQEAPDRSAIFVRPFDPVRDILYIPFDKWIEASWEAFEEVEGRGLWVTRNEVRRIAIPPGGLVEELYEDLGEDGYQYDWERCYQYDWTEVWDNRDCTQWPKLETLYVVRNPQPRMFTSSPKSVVPWQGQVCGSRRISLPWNYFRRMWDDGEFLHGLLMGIGQKFVESEHPPAESPENYWTRKGMDFFAVYLEAARKGRE